MDVSSSPPNPPPPSLFLSHPVFLVLRHPAELYQYQHD